MDVYDNALKQMEDEITNESLDWSSSTVKMKNNFKVSVKDYTICIIFSVLSSYYLVSQRHLLFFGGIVCCFGLL